MQKPWKRGEALSGTRTPDPLLTMEGNSRNDRTRLTTPDTESPAPAGNPRVGPEPRLTLVDASFGVGCAQGVPTKPALAPGWCLLAWAGLGLGTWAVLAG